MNNTIDDIQNELDKFFQSKLGKLSDAKANQLNGAYSSGKINAESGHSKKQFQKIAALGLGGKATHKKNPELYKELGKKLGKIQSKSKSTCPHCNKTGQTRVMKLWHFDNCLSNPDGPKKNRIDIKNTNGEKNHNSILTDEQAKEIRKIFIPYHKEFGATPLSKRYNVSRNIINKIVNNYTYKNI